MSIRAPQSVRTLEAFTRTRLSASFFMRDFLFSEIAAIEGMRNLPSDPDLAIAAGRALCQLVLEPLQATFGRLNIRSAYRSPEVNQFGNTHFKSCANNTYDRGRHIWDQRDPTGGMGAMTTVVVPWLADRVAAGGGDWTQMAWWIHDHLPYSDLQFFPKLAAFNISWHERPRRRITSFVAPRGLLTKPGLPDHEGDHSAAYRGYPTLVAAPPAPADIAVGNGFDA